MEFWNNTIESVPDYKEVYYPLPFNSYLRITQILHFNLAFSFSLISPDTAHNVNTIYADIGNQNFKLYECLALDKCNSISTSFCF